MLNAAQQRFAEALAEGKNQEDAYKTAFPKSKNPRQDSARLMSGNNPTKPDIEAELKRIRQRAQEKAGGTVCTVIGKRRRLCRIVEESDNDLVVISAIKTDNDMDPDAIPIRVEVSGNISFRERLATIRDKK